MCGNSEAGILPDPCAREMYAQVVESGLPGSPMFPGKEEAPTVSTTGVVEKDEFPSPSGKPKDDGFMPKDCVVVEPGW
jgi:hypothetical protein